MFLLAFCALVLASCDSKPKGSSSTLADQEVSKASKAIQKSKALLAQGEADSALTILANAYAIDTTNFDLALMLADLYWDNGKYGEAIKAYSTCVKLNDKDPQVWLRLGKSYYYRTNYESAMKYLNNALRLDKNLTDAYFWKAYIYWEMGDKEKAISNMQTAVQADPRNEQGFVKLAEWHFVDSNDLAIDYYSTALNIDSSKATTWQGRGNYYHTIKQDFAQARKDYLRALQVDSVHEQTIFNLATLELETGEYKQAEKLYKQLSKLNTQSKNALLGLGLAYKAQGKKRRAKMAFKRILDIDPNDADAQAELSQLN